MQSLISHLKYLIAFCYSHDRDGTYNFNLGVGEVIKGMDMGMKGMCKGEKRKITIPPELGYGGRDLGKLSCFLTHPLVPSNIKSRSKLRSKWNLWENLFVVAIMLILNSKYSVKNLKQLAYHRPMSQ